MNLLKFDIFSQIIIIPFNYLQQSLFQPWLSIYLKFLSICLFYGALVHLGNILGFAAQPWSEMPIHWQLMDIILLLFNLLVSIGLWFRRVEGVIAFILGIISLQIIPYTIFRQYFIQTPEDVITLNSLMTIELILITIFVVLIMIKK